MNRRRLGVLVLLAALGVGAGFGARALLVDDEPTRIDDAAPVAASSPSVPRNPEVKVLDDPDTPALKPNLPTHLEKVGTKPFVVKLPIPDGWKRYDSTPGEWRWYDPDQPMANSFFLRVRQVGNRYQPVPVALQERIGDLDSATDAQEFELESQSGDTFVASYVAGGYRRVSVETFVDLDDNDVADVWIAVVGRERDRIGLTDLVTQVKGGASDPS